MTHYLKLRAPVENVNMMPYICWYKVENATTQYPQKLCQNDFPNGQFAMQQPATSPQYEQSSMTQWEQSSITRSPCCMQVWTDLHSNKDSWMLTWVTFKGLKGQHNWTYMLTKSLESKWHGKVANPCYFIPLISMAGAVCIISCSQFALGYSSTPILGPEYQSDKSKKLVLESLTVALSAKACLQPCKSDGASS